MSRPSFPSWGFGALLVGDDDGGRLWYAGRLAWGFGRRPAPRLHGTLVARERSLPALSADTAAHGSPRRGSGMVTPDLVAEVRFAEWTKEGILRQPSFQGLRTDKPAREIVREQPAGSIDRRYESASPQRPSTIQTVHAGSSRTDLTNPDRVLYPDLGLTKADLARYYEQVGEWILPHLRGRAHACSLSRRVSIKCFYQNTSMNGCRKPSVVSRSRKTIAARHLYGGRHTGCGTRIGSDGCPGTAHVGGDA